MSKEILTDDEWILEWRKAGCSPDQMAKNTGINVRRIYERRNRLEAKGYTLSSHSSKLPAWAYHRIRETKFPEGVCIVYSDAHFWPEKGKTLAFIGLLELCRALKPKVVIANGDLLDGASISRFPSSGWARVPKMVDELGEMQLRQAEVRKAAKGAELYRTVGNHDVRLDRFFRTNADQFEGVQGVRLADYLPDWPESWNVRVNDTIVRHRFRGGINAPRNNVLSAGCSIVTGHLHTMGERRLSGYRDWPVWGVETGTISTPSWHEPVEGDGPFEYTEDSPTDWVSGFAVLTYTEGRLLRPEFCEVVGRHAWFRGKIVA